VGTPWARLAKSAFDRVAAALGLVGLLPLFVLIALGVWWDVGRPILFRQRRPGLHGWPFVLYKFRTMRDGTGDDASRLTAFGRFLRASSLDELPELLNVLRGEMSLVGPRPLLLEYLDLYTPEEARRHEMRPGITGLAQVSGRNQVPWPERLALDVFYVDHWSLALDARILARTFAAVLNRRGIHGEGHATMAPFQGTAISVSTPPRRPA
jgi:lipopolysaccharide/colanic/teichoic acid biosynthesis glycosyltransferase